MVIFGVHEVNHFLDLLNHFDVGCASILIDVFKVSLKRVKLELTPISACLFAVGIDVGVHLVDVVAQICSHFLKVVTLAKSWVTDSKVGERIRNI